MTYFWKRKFDAGFPPKWNTFAIHQWIPHLSILHSQNMFPCLVYLAQGGLWSGFCWVRFFARGYPTAAVYAIWDDTLIKLSTSNKYSFSFFIWHIGPLVRSLINNFSCHGLPFFGRIFHLVWRTYSIQHIQHIQHILLHLFHLSQGGSHKDYTQWEKYLTGVPSLCL